MGTPQIKDNMPTTMTEMINNCRILNQIDGFDREIITVATVSYIPEQRYKHNSHCIGLGLVCPCLKQYIRLLVENPEQFLDVEGPVFGQTSVVSEQGIESSTVEIYIKNRINREYVRFRSFLACTE